jgi:hypothetical protein
MQQHNKSLGGFSAFYPFNFANISISSDNNYPINLFVIYFFEA